MGQKEVEDFLRDNGPASATMISAATGWKLSTVRSNIRHLKKWGAIRQVAVAVHPMGGTKTIPVWGISEPKDI